MNNTGPIRTEAFADARVPVRHELPERQVDPAMLNRPVGELVFPTAWAAREVSFEGKLIAYVLEFQDAAGHWKTYALSEQTLRGIAAAFADRLFAMPMPTVHPANFSEPG